MFQRDDTTYNDIRRKSLDQWLAEMENHDDIAVRGGVACFVSADIPLKSNRQDSL